ncbi:cysteine proteinase [Cladorrhinum sp. PSN259]|nr:cysteine proteinase [Cladorrhinum sp. PSN259]
MSTPALTTGKKKDFSKTPQELVHEFWDRYFTKKPGKVTRIFPRSLYATLLPAGQSGGATSTRNAAESYEAAAKECREKVKRIIRECNRTNEKFTDPDFDIEWDWANNCLNGLVRDEYEYQSGDAGSGSVPAWQLKDSLDTLVQANVLGSNGTVPLDPGVVKNYVNEDFWAQFAGIFGAHGSAGNASSASASGGGSSIPKQGPAPKSSRPKTAPKLTKGGVKAGEYYNPGSKHRLDWIFESPKWTVDGYSSSDIKQGGNGDCWWLAAVATIAHRKELMEKVCVIRDEEIGVYGFVFYRDGEWISTVVDDTLYLKHEDFDYQGDTYDSTGKRAREWRKRHQTGSEALYFAKCDDPNETWLPLLEKAYAKVHGDYEAISGGWSGEAVEDMTGGVTSTVASNRVLRKDKLWKELANNEEFVFALSAIGTGWDSQKSGLALGHAYSILKAVEEVDEDGNKVRLVKIRNPWGERAWNGIGEWNGPWSDGSREWTPYWLKKLDHRFGDDGVFWMSYKDMLETFLFIHRTRIFDDKWTVVQQWTSLNVGWVVGYLNTKFIIEVKKAGTVVIVLSQLDERYFVGFEGQYVFALHFLLQAEGSDEHLCRVRPVHDWENRSVSCELDLEPGRYEVLPKITAERLDGKDMVEDVVKKWADRNPAKLRQIGMQYDLAHAKGGVPDEDEILLKKKAEEKKKADEKKRKAKEKARRKKLKEKLAAKQAEVTVTISAGETTVSTTGDVKTDDKKEDGSAKKKEEKKTEDSKDDTKEEEKFEDAVEKKEEEPKEETKKAEEKKELSTGAAPAAADKEKKPEDGEKKAEEGEKKAEEGEKKDDAPAAAEEEEEESEEEDNSEEEEKKKEEEEEARKLAEDAEEGRVPWNAVCVVGLRVYSKEPDVSVHLAKPKSEEEAASLVLDSKAVGATM